MTYRRKQGYRLKITEQRMLYKRLFTKFTKQAGYTLDAYAEIINLFSNVIRYVGRTLSKVDNR